MPIIESALGVEKAFEIASSSDNIVAMAIGLEDYTTDFGVSGQLKAKNLFMHRQELLSPQKQLVFRLLTLYFLMLLIWKDSGKM